MVWHDGSCGRWRGSAWPRAVAASPSHGEPHIQQENAPKEAQVEVKKQSETEYLVTAKTEVAQTSANVAPESDVL